MTSFYFELIVFVNFFSEKGILDHFGHLLPDKYEIVQVEFSKIILNDLLLLFPDRTFKN